MENSFNLSHDMSHGILSPAAVIDPFRNAISQIVVPENHRTAKVTHHSVKNTTRRRKRNSVEPISATKKVEMYVDPRGIERTSARKHASQSHIG